MLGHFLLLFIFWRRGWIYTWSGVFLGLAIGFVLLSDVKSFLKCYADDEDETVSDYLPEGISILVLKVVDVVGFWSI